MPGLPDELREKDLFGMGYPYYVCLYANLIAFSTDYGVAQLKYDQSKLIDKWLNLLYLILFGFIIIN